ncbi:response regulator transcription factor [Microbacterium suwonense]|uniref:Uncharacterized protein n=1 Tax=Microbacterium suwonense TaxID=683047 RepID=A0ABM8FUC3_9MICO|nr:response regulator transcription factor [Microbacterium suwonense]BDZ39169.1 hypothetical protein GCM10025863_17830 [Microbacterium suwonense]
MTSEANQAAKTAVVIEDDPDVRHLLSEVLESAGFSTISAGNGIDGVSAVLTYQPLITTVDVNMPGIDGFEAVRRIRAHSDTYIIMLTALDEEADAVLGLTAGADEYLNKPFRPRELRARVEAMLRRPRGGAGPAATPSDAVGRSFPASSAAHGQAPGTVQSGAPESAEVASGGARLSPVAAVAVEASDAEEQWTTHRDLQLNPATRIVRIGDAEIELTRTEFDLLHALMESKRRVRSKTDLTLVLRGESYVTSYFVGDADKRAIEAHMANLRRKLGDNPAQPQYIETVRGVGYRLTSGA